MSENEVLKIINNLSDEIFIEIFRKSKKRIKEIEKKEKFKAVEQKFKEKGKASNVQIVVLLCVLKMAIKIANKDINVKIVILLFMLLKNIIFIEVIYLMINEIY